MPAVLLTPQSLAGVASRRRDAGHWLCLAQRPPPFLITWDSLSLMEYPFLVAQLISAFEAAHHHSNDDRRRLKCSDTVTGRTGGGHPAQFSECHCLSKTPLCLMKSHLTSLTDAATRRVKANLLLNSRNKRNFKRFNFANQMFFSSTIKKRRHFFSLI